MERRQATVWEGRRTEAHKGDRKEVVEGDAQGTCVLREKEEGLQDPPETPHGTGRVKWISTAALSCFGIKKIKLL